MNQPVVPQLLALVEGPNLVLDKPIVLIGRHQECDIQIPSRKISRRHCCIAQVADHLVIRDLGSTNGIRINGLKIIEGNMKPNDELMIGNMRYKLHWESAVAPPGHAPGKNGSTPNQAKAPVAESFLSMENPLPLPDQAMSHPILQAKPNPAAANAADPIPPMPLEPPPFTG